jgi:hypothetical protein
VKTGRRLSSVTFTVHRRKSGARSAKRENIVTRSRAGPPGPGAQRAPSSDHVGEHHGDLAALGGVLGLGLHSGGGFRYCWGRARKLADGREYFSADARAGRRPSPDLDRLDGRVPRHQFRYRQSAARIARDRAFRASPQFAACGHPPTQLAVFRTKISDRRSGVNSPPPPVRSRRRSWIASDI